MAVAEQVESNTPEAWARLESSPQWKNLTDSQRIFVREFLATGSALLATKAGYKTKSEANARVLSYELAKNRTIQAAINVAQGRAVEVESERTNLIAMVRKQLRAAEKGSIAASRFAAQLERLTLGDKSHADAEPVNSSAPIEAALTAEDSPTFYVGQLVTQRDEYGILHNGRVLAVANGKPTDIEEVE